MLQRFSREFIEYVSGAFLQHLWIISGASLQHLWSISGASLEYVWNISGASFKSCVARIYYKSKYYSYHHYNISYVDTIWEFVHQHIMCVKRNIRAGALEFNGCLT